MEKLIKLLWEKIMKDVLLVLLMMELFLFGVLSLINVDKMKFE